MAVNAVAVTIGAALLIHGEVTGGGVVGWLNHVQLSWFGSYDVKVTFLVVLSALMLAGGLVAFVLGKALGVGGAAGSRAADSPRPASPRSLLYIFAGFTAAIWIAGVVVYRRHAAGQRGDATAVYEPVILGAGEPPPLHGAHLALRGEPLAEHALVHRTNGEEDYTLTPIVAPGWRPGTPAAFVVKTASAAELSQTFLAPGPMLPDLSGLTGGASARRAAAEPSRTRELLVRLDGEVDIPAAKEFERRGVPLGEPNHLLHLVPSAGGKPLVADTSAQDFMLMLVGCSVLTFMTGVFVIAARIGMKRRDARARRLTGKEGAV